MNIKIKKILNKKNKSKVICLTAYSKNVASILDKHCDLVLVGDSLGSVLYNYKSTKEVSLDTMINHSKSVRFGVKKSLMVVDMPYNTYNNPKTALKNAKKIMSKTKCDAVKDQKLNFAKEQLKKLNVQKVFGISSVSGENITKLVRQLQDLITSMNKIEYNEDGLEKVSSWSP